MIACQHCPARIVWTGDQPAGAWIDPDATSPDRILWCVPGAGDVRGAVWHSPMPRVGVRVEGS